MVSREPFKKRVIIRGHIIYLVKIYLVLSVPLSYMVSDRDVLF